MQKTLTLSLFIFLFLCRSAGFGLTITNLSTTSQAIGTAVMINGTGFDATAANNVVYFGSVRATSIIVTGTTVINATVPLGAAYGQITVTTIGATKLTARSAQYFAPKYNGYTGAVAAGNFDAPINFTSGGNPQASAIGDFDGDGRTDIAVVNINANTLSIFLNNSTVGSITSASFIKTDIATLANGPIALTTTDFNSDGKTDIAVAYQNGTQISVFSNTSTGTGVISFKKNDYFCGGSSNAIAAGDLDKDGRMDIVVTNFSLNTISVLRNNSSSTSVVLSFVAHVDFATGRGPNGIVIADLNGDSYPEMVVSNLLDNNFCMYQNAHTGGITSTVFPTKVNGPTLSGRPTGLFASIVINPGLATVIIPDLIVTVDDPLTGINRLAVLKNTITTAGAAIVSTSFSVQPTINTGNQPLAASMGDIDGDGTGDLLAANYNTKTLSVFRNTSAGTLAVAAKFDFPTGNTPHALSVGDLDNDGQQDIIAVNDLDNTISILHSHNSDQTIVPGPAFAESTPSASLGSLVNTDVTDFEWGQDAPAGYTVAAISGSGVVGAANAGRYAYFSTTGSAAVNGTLTFSAKIISGSGSIVVKMIPTDYSPVTVSKSFPIGAGTTYSDFGWNITGLDPQKEYFLAILVPSGITIQFKKNMCLALQQGNMNGNFTRYRADLTSLIGNTEGLWYGWNDAESTASQPKKKYIQHSAFARMRFTTNATQIMIEYVRDMSDSHVSNLFPAFQALTGADWNTDGSIKPGANTIDSAIRVTAGKRYTISGLKTHAVPGYVWFSNGLPLGPSANMSNIGTTTVPVYTVTAPTGATNLAIMVQKITDLANPNSPSNDTYMGYANCMVQEGRVGDVTTYDGVIPSPVFLPYKGHAASRVSGPAVFVNGKLFNYYQVDGTDKARQVQYISDVLPTGTKTVEVMMPGQALSGLTSFPARRFGTYLRAVYFPSSATTVLPATTVTTGSMLYVHDDILSGPYISTDAQNNVWMMKTQRDSTIGFTGDVFSEGYAGRTLHMNTFNADSLESFAQKLNRFHVSKYWFQIGANDYLQATPLLNFYTEYKTLLDRLKALGTSSTKIYVQAIGPEVNDGPNQETMAYNGQAGGGPSANDFRDVQRATANSRTFCEYVDFENLFDKTAANLADGINPTDQGNALYANGVKSSSTLLGATIPSAPLTLFTRDPYYRITSLTQSVSGIAVITARGGSTPYTFTLGSGSMPAGLTLNADGVITGTPTVSGYFPINVHVVDAAGAYLNTDYALMINPTPVVAVVPLRIKGATVSSTTLYTKNVKGAFGLGKYIYSQTGLPTGFAIDAATGIISGYPTTANPGANFTVTATDHYGFTGHTNYTLKITTGAPAALTDKFIPSATISTTGELMVKGSLTDYYNETVIASISAVVTQGSNVTNYPAKNVYIVNNGVLTGSAEDFGAIITSKGTVTSVKLTVSMLPVSLTQVSTNDPVTLTYDTTTTITGF